LDVHHNPVADEACHMLIERKSTLHTAGSEVTDRTRLLDEQLPVV